MVENNKVTHSTSESGSEHLDVSHIKYSVYMAFKTWLEYKCVLCIYLDYVHNFSNYMYIKYDPLAFPTSIFYQNYCSIQR